MLQTFSSSDAHKHIPSGIKTDVYFVVDNTENMRRRGKGNRSTFSDDGGIWNTSTGLTPKTYYMRTESGAVKNIVRKHYQFCIAKKEKGKYKYIPLDPQPDASKKVELVRFYTSLKKDYSYKKE